MMISACKLLLPADPGSALAAHAGAAFDDPDLLREQRTAVWRLFVAVFLMMQVMMMAAPAYLPASAASASAAVLERRSAALPDAVERIGPDGSSCSVAPSRLRAGDLVRVCAGQAFPADGRIESLPLAKGAGDEVVAASLNLQSPLRVRVQRVGADTRHQAIQRLMRGAMTQRPPASTELAVRAVWVAVSVLIVICPCALSLAAPSARLAATGALAKRGICCSGWSCWRPCARLTRCCWTRPAP